MTDSALGSAVAILERHYGRPPPPIATTAFELILAENVAYLASDPERRAALEKLRRTVGTRPDEIASASRSELQEITTAGILPARFAEKLKACGRIALEEFEGDLESVLKLPPAAAKKALRKFPGIGEPGAEKILLFAGHLPLLAPESNGLRVLVRLRLVPERKSYGATYAGARALGDQLGGWRTVSVAHRLLRHHGQTLCRRTNPRCAECPLRARCPSAA
jgi:endonuclease-3